ncbi:SWIM zinc finger family protein [Propionispora hippei]|uniref:SWIM zinc finger n=1 Tax=Propionispora hippei DSM 15287 TaxID=1123003 RepID=A0A1M6H4J6_9FIRM|nr:SWIM zinc finger family protein [Propionispora hippei]SHJ17098.1 SWIM zinc finger [Propionispora hippei DSM 15287]
MHNKFMEQGFEYYWNGAVQQLTKTEAATYLAMIRLEEKHTVTLKLDDSGAILWTHCSCSCSAGPCCKHIAAAYVALQHQNSSLRYTKGGMKTVDR